MFSNTSKKILFFSFILIIFLITVSEVNATPSLSVTQSGNRITYSCTNVQGNAFFKTGESNYVNGKRLFDIISGSSGSVTYSNPGDYVVSCFDGRFESGRVRFYQSFPRMVIIGTTSSPTPSPTPTPPPTTTPRYQVTVLKSGDGAGTVTGAGTYNQGTSVTLRAEAHYGSTFVSWSGVTCSQGNSNRDCTITVSGARTATARFDKNTYTLTISKSGSGTIMGGGISTSTTPKTIQLAYGTSVTTNAQPSSGFSFSQWNGDCTGSGICSFTMTRNMNVHATFIQAQGTLYLGTAGQGSGKMEGAGATCFSPSICPVSVNVGQEYTIRATPSFGSQLTNLEGCTLTSANTCTITIPSGSTIRTVTATFITQ